MSFFLPACPHLANRDKMKTVGYVFRVDVYVSFPCQQAGTLQIRKKIINVGYVLLVDVDVTMSSMRTPGNQGEDVNCGVRVTGRCRWRSERRKNKNKTVRYMLRVEIDVTFLSNMRTPVKQGKEKL